MKATKVKDQSNQAKFIPMIVEDLIAVLKSYPLSEDNYKENEELI